MDESPHLQFDKILHQETRLAIVGLLAREGPKTFTQTRRVLAIKYLNSLSRHAKILEDAGYIKQSKKFVGKVAQTTFTLTVAGRAAVARYRDMIIRTTEAAE